VYSRNYCIYRLPVSLQLYATAVHAWGDTRIGADGDHDHRRYSFAAASALQLKRSINPINATMAYPRGTREERRGRQRYEAREERRRRKRYDEERLASLERYLHACGVLGAGLAFGLSLLTGLTLPGRRRVTGG
jgi:hypothetical protein